MTRIADSDFSLSGLMVLSLSRTRFLAHGKPDNKLADFLPSKLPLKFDATQKQDGQLSFGVFVLWPHE